MKSLKSNFASAGAMLLLTILISLLACSKEFNPRTPQDEALSEAIQKPNDLQILSYGKVLPSLKKTIVVSEYFEEDDGGHLRLRYKIDTETGDVFVNINLKIQRNSLSSDAEISMTLDDQTFLADLDLLFGPSGLDFLKPALIDVYIDGIDLTDVDPSSINIYYYDATNNDWIKMKSRKVEVDIERSKIKVDRGELPHFSRYALCKG